MSNTILIKHGAAAPTSSNLGSYELGYSENTQGLYIKNNNEEIIHLNKVDIVAGNADIMVVTDLEVSIDGEIADTTFPTYPYRIDIPIEDMTENWNCLSLTVLDEKEYFGPIVQTKQGFLSVWVLTPLTSSITINNAVFVKEVE